MITTIETGQENQMADQPPKGNGADGSGAEEASEGVTFAIGAQYIQDLSFENPRGAEAMAALEESPNVNIDVRTSARAASAGMYEVSLFIRAEAKTGDSTMFIVELTYGGLVQVGGASEEEAKPIVMIEGPRLLFPFARAIVSNTVRDGGFPPLMVNPIDFAALYVEQHVDDA